MPYGRTYEKLAVHISFLIAGMRDCYIYLDYSCSGSEFSTYNHINGNYYFRSDFLNMITSDKNNVILSDEQRQREYMAIENHIKAIAFADCIFTPLYEERVYLNGSESNFDLEESSLDKSGFVNITHESYMADEWNNVANPKSYLHDAFCRLDMLLAANLPQPENRER